MNKKRIFKILSPILPAFCLLLTAFCSQVVFAQDAAQKPPLLKRTKHASETIEFGSGGTITIKGAPLGSIEVEGWEKNEVEINAAITVQAENEDDLKKLADVCGFLVDNGLTHLQIMSVGTENKKYLKSVSEKLPTHLRNTPYTVNYKIKAPHFVDLNVDGGIGDLNISMLGGAMKLNYLRANAKLNLLGGSVRVTIGAGNVDVKLLTRGRRESQVDVQLARGDLTIWLPQNMNANLTARVLRSGKIDNYYELMKPVSQTKFTDKGIQAKVGNGGAALSFTVGDGTLTIAGY